MVILERASIFDFQFSYTKYLRKASSLEDFGGQTGSWFACQGCALGTFLLCFGGELRGGIALCWSKCPEQRICRLLGIGAVQPPGSASFLLSFGEQQK